MPQGPGASQGTISSQSADDNKHHKSRKTRGGLKGTTGTGGEGATYASGVGSIIGTSTALRRTTAFAPPPQLARAQTRAPIQVPHIMVP